MSTSLYIALFEVRPQHIVSLFLVLSVFIRLYLAFCDTIVSEALSYCDNYKVLSISSAANWCCLLIAWV